MSIELADILGGISTAITGTPGLGLGISGALGLGGQKGIVGGTILARTRGFLEVQTPAGKRVLIKTAKRSRRQFRAYRRSPMDKMMEMAMVKSLLK